MKPRFHYYLAEVPMRRGRRGVRRQDWRWHLKGGNGEIIASGEGYVSRASVRRAVRAVVRCAAKAETVEGV